ncbi:CPXCG motif-containing cysteine-rich protein [Parahaliea mediterranea]|uniref:CPXCG motif-containing cysteine-rich protein n=1 Tax=Parahaliea mediterranea TaxID=651086 RepID=A0A939ILI7_9GAMM|nr:CPXCG motif-containing cysteine-rich protein [Parahaliea mediterranea]
MTGLDEQAFSCPYCGERITVLIDTSLASQAYIEDCQVCCSPILLHIATTPAGEVAVRAYREDEAPGSC